MLDSEGSLKPREFAQKMWPDSEGWRRSAKCGPHGSHRGGGMYLAGGGYLGKLNKRGWIDYLGWRKGYELSTAGRRVLDLPT